LGHNPRARTLRSRSPRVGRMNLARIAPQRQLAHDPGRMPTVIAWDEAAACLAAGDFAGFDSAMRIFRKLTREAGVPNKQPASNS
jgi:hypothetical protein